MQNRKLLYLLPVLFFATILIAADFNTANQEETFKSISKATSSANSTENFDKMISVFTHPRCMNCHPSDNVPKQGEDSHPHYFGMARGIDNMGFQATNCNTCHQKENNDFSGVPGAPHWSLAPESMKWEGLTPREIVQSILDPKRNGGRTQQEVIEHLTEDKLVLWAWTPGIDAEGNPRQAPPVLKEEYIKAVKEWFAAGAIIPEK